MSLNKPYPPNLIDYADWDELIDYLNAVETATITAGDTYKVVTHGLGYVPKPQVTPTSNLAGRNFWVSDVGSTTFRININSSDLADHTFNWAVR